MHPSVLSNAISWNHFDIAHSLSSAYLQLHWGCLADALTVLRPAVENMIDIQYFRRWAGEFEKYKEKSEELLTWLSTARREGIFRRDPQQSLRFETAGKMCEYIVANSPNQYEERLAYQWQLLSNIADHVSLERHFYQFKVPQLLDKLHSANRYDCPHSVLPTLQRRF